MVPAVRVEVIGRIKGYLLNFLEAVVGEPPFFQNLGSGPRRKLKLFSFMVPIESYTKTFLKKRMSWSGSDDSIVDPFFMGIFSLKSQKTFMGQKGVKRFKDLDICIEINAAMFLKGDEANVVADFRPTLLLIGIANVRFIHRRVGLVPTDPFVVR